MTRKSLERMYGVKISKHQIKSFVYYRVEGCARTFSTVTAVEKFLRSSR